MLPLAELPGLKHFAERLLPVPCRPTPPCRPTHHPSDSNQRKWVDLLLLPGLPGLLILKLPVLPLAELPVLPLAELPGLPHFAERLLPLAERLLPV